MKTLTCMFLFLASLCCADDNLELLVSSEEIAQKITEAAAQIDREYQDQELTIIMVMKGAVCGAADLMRELHIPVTLEFIKASSYGNRGAVSGELIIKGLEMIDVANKNVLIVDDIFDSGKTMTALVARFKEMNPKSLKTFVVLAKEVPRNTTYYPDYVLFEIGNRFVVGYGLDYKEQYRNLPGIYAFINDTPPQ